MAEDTVANVEVSILTEDTLPAVADIVPSCPSIDIVPVQSLNVNAGSTKASWVTLIVPETVWPVLK